MSDEELIARLHLPWPKDANVGEVTLPTWVLALTAEAADRIEGLTKERDEWQSLAEATIKDDATKNVYYAEMSAKLATASHNAAVFGHKIVDLEAKLAMSVLALDAWLNVAAHCSIEEGVCCCGDDMENHSPPMTSGHTPLDHGSYIAGRLEETTRTTLAELSSASCANSKGEQP